MELLLFIFIFIKNYQEKNSLNSNYPLQAKFTLNNSSLTKIMYKKFYYEFITFFLIIIKQR